MKKILFVFILFVNTTMTYSQEFEWIENNTYNAPGERVVAILDAGTVNSYEGLQIIGQVIDNNGNWGYKLPTVADFSLFVKLYGGVGYQLAQSKKTNNIILGLRKVSETVYHLTANCPYQHRAVRVIFKKIEGSINVTMGDPEVINTSGNKVIEKPTYGLNQAEILSFNQTKSGVHNYFSGNIYMQEATSGSSKIHLRGHSNDMATISSEVYDGNAATRMVFEVADDTNDYIQFRHKYWDGGKITNLMDLKLTQTVIHKPLGVGIAPSCGKMLTVNGTILAKEIEVSTELDCWPDYVFEDEYPLRKLSDVESFIKTNKHLPDMPSAATVAKDGVKLAEMNKQLLQKVEELTLYLIEKDKEVKQLNKARKEEHKQRMNLEKRLAKIEATLK